MCVADAAASGHIIFTVDENMFLCSFISMWRYQKMVCVFMNPGESLAGTVLSHSTLNL